jgi:Na+-driven multidrug efflux pump
LANLASTAAINSFDGTVYISARSIATDIDHLTSTIAAAFLPASLNAVAQNAGAKRPDRIKKIFFYSCLQAAVIIGVLSNILRIFAGEVSLIFIEANDPFLAEKVAAVETWCGHLLTLQFLLAMLNSALGVIRGLGYSLLPLIFNLIGTVGTRLAWIYLVFYKIETRTLEDFRTLSTMYPLSWGVAAILIGGLCIYAFSRLDSVIEERNAKKNKKKTC